ncbi:hypothetical protein NP233_g1043 [Leucocoprinus birnbaumii]|uniref:DUF6699 domain-containing protein n=1 Tax=Leucocoprinus birnbaumii TaxID=56174 RepID=A0AAD5W130_9AGAR|nr:hypothetical protein NP233_g1043 [Leucocoprinus birnbaumii]
MWSPPHDDMFAAFPGHNKSASHGGGSPWGPPQNQPPSWVQSATPAPPAWATSSPHSPTLAWGAPSPFGNQGGSDDHWGTGGGGGWGSAARDSAFGAPMTPGFFGANASPNNTPWSGIMQRSTSEYTSPHTAAPPWATPHSPASGWNHIPRPKSAIGAGKYFPPSPSRIPAHLIPDTWDETNLARRPRDWRATYNPRASFLSSITVIPSAIKNLSDVQEYSDPAKRRMTPSLEYHAHQPPVNHDLRLDPFDPKTPIYHAQSSTQQFRNPFSDLDMAQFATSPTAKFLRLFHPRLPWYIDIHQSHPNGITVGDILTQLWTQLEQQILPRHYWNDVLNEKDRKDIGKAYKRRTDLVGVGEGTGDFVD